MGNKPPIPNKTQAPTPCPHESGEVLRGAIRLGPEERLGQEEPCSPQVTLLSDPPDELVEVSAQRLRAGLLFADRYRVIEAIGQGGMGAVYLVHDLRLKEDVALKLLTLPNARAVERFRQEVRLARRVTHRNVARTHDLGVHEQMHYLTMEHVAGRSLDSLLEQEGALGEKHSVRLAIEIAEGLEAAHQAQVVHRDLKPANIMVAGDRVVLTDFGIAGSLEDELKLTQPGSLVGTPVYMAPEQVEGNAAAAAADLFALGVILFESLTGELPFSGQSAMSMALARLSKPPTDPRQYRELDDELAEICLWCLARDPAHRPKSALELRQVLSDWLRSRLSAAPLDAAPLSAAPLSAAPLSAAPPGGGPSSAPSGEDTPSLAPEPSRRPSTGSMRRRMSPGNRTLAVLPFRYRGPKDEQYFAEGLTEELIDLLSETRGLRVLSFGAVERFHSDRDPATLRKELGADIVVDGSLQIGASGVRLTSRIIDAQSGLQLSSGRHDVPLSDVLLLQESLSKQVAEALRLELVARRHGMVTDPEVIALYLKAKKLARATLVVDNNNILAMFTECVRRAPDFGPARAALAVCAVVSWWTEDREALEPRRDRALRLIGEAEFHSPELADTHLARGMFACQVGDYRQATEAFLRANRIAPTSPEVHRYLAMLEAETGKVQQARARFELVLQLDPTVNTARIGLHQIESLVGSPRVAAAELRKLLGGPTINEVLVLAAIVRCAIYEGDLEWIRKSRAELKANSFGGPFSTFWIEFCGLITGEIELPRAKELMLSAKSRPMSPRLHSYFDQLFVETMMATGEIEVGLSLLEAMGEGIFLDLLWLQHCKLLDPLRSRPQFRALTMKVRRRGLESWPT